MKYKLIALLVIAIAGSKRSSACSGNKIGERLQMVWLGVKNLACNYLETTSTARKARSMDFSSPSSVFSYLYPHSDVEDPAELLKGRSGPVAAVGVGRSLVPLPTSPMVTEWVEDFLDFVGADCYGRKRGVWKSQARRRARSQVRFQGQTPKLTWQNITSHYQQLQTGTSPPLSDRQGYAAAAAEDAEDEEELEMDEEHDDVDITQDDSSEEEGLGGSGGAQDGSATTVEPEAATSAPLVTTTPITQDDPHFSSYGGDIEYVFPIISFNVPFDGEIVVIGFHGYDGLWNTY